MINLKSFNLLDLTSQVSRIHVVQSFDLKYGQVMTSLQMLWMINTIRYWTCDLWKQVWGNQFPTSQCRIQETTTWSERSPQESPQKEVWKWHHSMLPRFAEVLSLYFSLVSCVKKSNTQAMSTAVASMLLEDIFTWTSSLLQTFLKMLGPENCRCRKYVEWWTISLGTHSMHILTTFHQAAISACHNETI